MADRIYIVNDRVVWEAEADGHPVVVGKNILLLEDTSGGGGITVPIFAHYYKNINNKGAS